MSVISGFQTLAARNGSDAVPAMLAEQGLSATAEVEPLSWAVAGVASDGRSLDGLMDYSRSQAVTPAQFDRIVLTQFADAARAASLVSMSARPDVSGWTRMLTPPSCSRCVVLAGKFYRLNTGFSRHPRCDCVHIPTRENVAGDLTTDPKTYFDSLSVADQDRVFTKAGAEVIRNGAGIGQVVNARAGMSTAQVLRGSGSRYTATGRLVARDVFGRPLYTTTEGMTTRGAAYKARGRNYVRIMPESIVQLAAGDRGELLRLLKAHGYVK